MRSQLMLVLSLSLAACSGGFDEEITNETPAVGFVRVTAATAGLGLDPDGYTVTRDRGAADSATQELPSNGKADFGGLPVGDHTFVLEGVADNCALTPDATQPLTVLGGQVQPIAYSITCSAPPLTGPNLIAFESDRDGFAEIYTMNPDGSSQSRVTQDELVNIRNYVNRNFSGWTLREARLELLRRMDMERAVYDAGMRKLAALYQKRGRRIVP